MEGGQAGPEGKQFHCLVLFLVFTLTDIPVLASLGNGMTLCSGSTVQLYQSIFISINPF